MKEKFPGYYRLSKKEIDSIWTSGIYVFDTNVLLDFYRLSDKSCEALFDIFEKGKDKIWIPYQVAKEYHKDLYNVITEQVSNYDKVYESLNNFYTDINQRINEKKNHPFFDEKTNKYITQFYKRISKTITSKRNELIKNIADNPTKERLATILNHKVGDSFDDNTIRNIQKEGEERYKNLIPPGYKDNKKKDNPYGDLIIWKEILKKAKTDSKSIIFITGDLKEDWFLKTEKYNKTIGPRPELIEEFKKETKQSIYICSLNLFMSLAKEKGYSIESNVIDEIKHNDDSYSKIMHDYIKRHEYINNNPIISYYTDPNIYELTTNLYNKNYDSIINPDINNYSCGLIDPDIKDPSNSLIPDIKDLSNGLIIDPDIKDYSNSLITNPNIKDLSNGLIIDPDIKDYSNGLITNPNIKDPSNSFIIDPDIKDYSNGLITNPNIKDPSNNLIYPKTDDKILNYSSDMNKTNTKSNSKNEESKGINQLKDSSKDKKPDKTTSNKRMPKSNNGNN